MRDGVFIDSFLQLLQLLDQSLPTAPGGESRQRMHAAIAIVIIMLWLHLTTLTSEFDRLNALAPHDRFMHLVKRILGRAGRHGTLFSASLACPEVHEVPER